MNMEELDKMIISAFQESHKRKPTAEEVEKLRKDIIILMSIHGNSMEG
jgi:hypothetical protein